MKPSILLVALVALFAACSDDDGGSQGDDPRIAEWLSTTAGHELTYSASISCGICEAGGTWQITERDGNTISAEFLDHFDMSADASPLTLTEALELARSATGPVVVVSSASDAIHFQVDQDTSAIDDEFSYSVVDVTIKD